MLALCPNRDRPKRVVPPQRRKEKNVFRRRRGQRGLPARCWCVCRLSPPVGVSKMILLGVLRFHAVWKVTEEIVIRVATACRPSHGGGVVGCRDLSHNDLEPTGAGRGQIVRLPELTGGQSSFFGGSSLFVTSHGTPLTIGLI